MRRASNEFSMWYAASGPVLAVLPMVAIMVPPGRRGPTSLRVPPASLSNSAVAWAGVALLIGAIPADPKGYTSYLALRWLTMTVAIGLGLVCALRSGGQIRRSLVLPGVAVLASSLLSALLSGSPWVGVFGLPGRRSGVLALVVMIAAGALGCWCGTGDRRRWVMRGAAVAGLGIAVVALGQRWGVRLAGVAPIGISGRVTGVFGSATQLGAACVVLGPATVWLAADRGEPVGWRRVGGAGAVTLGVVLAMSGSRSAWVGAIAGAAWTAVLLRDRLVAARPRIIGGIAVGLFILLVLIVPTLRQRATTAVDFSGGTVGGRTSIWTAAWPAILDRPVLGWGPDQARTGLLHHLPADFESRYGDAEIVDRAHSVVLDQLLWSGVIGLAALVWLATAWGRHVWRCRAEPTSVVLAAGVVGFAGHLLFNFPMPEVDVIAWFVAGAAVGPVVVTTAPPVGRRVVGSVTSVAAAACALAVAVLAGRGLLADHALRRGYEAESRSNAAGAIGQYRQAAARAPELLENREVLARALVRYGAVDEAPSAAARVVAWAPGDPFSRELLLRAEVQRALSVGDVAAGRALVGDYERLVSDFPSRVPFRVGLALANLAAGSPDRAREIASAASAATPRSAAGELALVLIETRSGNPAAAEAHRVEAGRRTAP